MVIDEDGKVKRYDELCSTTLYLTSCWKILVTISNLKLES